MSKKFSLGIDLGTSNSCLSVSTADGTPPHTVDVTQVLGPALLGEKPILPSALYIPAESEYGPDSLKLPWSSEPPRHVIGTFARERGALVPDRLVSSAKSWLCNPHIDRYAPILPWKSELTGGAVSPFDASRLYLEHMRLAFEYYLAQKGEEGSIADCVVTLTVPASFDEIARSLTYEAAEAAGLVNVTLLEEPQAAFYAWIAQADASGAGRSWTEQVAAGDLVLVCDVGGGTADFSLIAVAEAQAGLSKNLELHRIAVGEHILLGGDNMDLALAYALQNQLEEEGHEIDQWQFLSLVQNARIAKERLLSDPDLAEFPIAVPSRGSSLFAQTVSTTLKREVAVAMILDGYFPLTEANELPERRKSVGLQEYGLDYATEPALSKHLARFLQRALENVRSDEKLSSLIRSAGLEYATLLKPTAVLFNGGVFQAEMLRHRVFEVLRSWMGPDHSIKELESAGLDIAVSRGAAYYGAVQLSGKGIKIRAGTSRSYYLGIESPMPAVPGFKPAVKGICVVPQGVEEGTELTLEGKEFGLVTGEPAEFRFFSSEVRAGDRIGTIVSNAEKALDELSSLSVSLPPIEGSAQQVVPVTLSPYITEVGTLELWMKHTQSEQKWKLEFNLRARD